MAGYQEILSDPSYCDQAVVMTYPLIGNYGMCDDDYETLFAYYVAKENGCDIDKPKNLAKSVTVE